MIKSMTTRTELCLIVALCFAGIFLGMTCDADAQNRIVCAVCKQPIHSNYIQLGNKCYHQNHLPKCSKCGKQLTAGFFELKNGSFLCEACAVASAPVCTCCGRKIMGPYSQFMDGIVACDSCLRSNFPRCSVCGSPFKKGVQLTDGRKLCGIHSGRTSLPAANQPAATQQTAGRTAGSGNANTGNTAGSQVDINTLASIVSVDQLRPYVAEAQRLITRHVSPKISFSGLKIDTFIVDQNTINLISPYKDVKGVTETQYQYLIRQGKTKTAVAADNGKFCNEFNVYILGGMHPKEAVSTICHELGHVWQNANCDTTKFTGRQKEGFCEWVAYKVDKGLGREDQIKQSLDNIYEDYSKGLQFYIDLERKVGVNGVLNYALGKDR